ncbi:SDR family NAD(P)-dependent oxidoreductase [Mycobacterium sp. RTGN5]|uniref:SDR family NAD(P)-dependent oxidoreductase n=1 Tax=Mycobacterium sp. RTGN5 TaxID=3016522 RepID=UPI0029C87F34|nr:SDR family NAD(P)-dependent oxidoreductase [Mycobacterium sp. RTGN5]
MTLDAQTVLITGAGAGVGRGIALAVATAGADVIVAARGDSGQQVVDEIRARGARAWWARCDVTDLDSVTQAIALALNATGRLDAVIHNATSNRSSSPHQLCDVDEALWEDHVSVSLRGAYHCAHAAFDALSDGGGTLVVMTSPAGIEGSATLPLYATVKGALRGFAKSLAREWAPAGITVNAVSPLAYSPAMTNGIKADPAMEDRLAKRVPMGRVGDPETDVGAAVALLIDPAARFITGQTIGIDGGHFTSV